MGEDRANGDVLKVEVYRELGLGGDPALYEEVLQAAGLSNPRKARIASAKRGQVAAALDGLFFRVCGRGDCAGRAAALAAGRKVVPAATQGHCEVCGGSVNRAAVERMVEACRARGWKRLAVVGGSPVTREEIAGLVGGRLELRMVDGTVATTAKQAAAVVAWADRVLVWGATQLDHKVSVLFRGPNVLTVRKRGIADLAASLVEHAGRG